MITEIIQAIILAVVEGITEFLPISSTGHIIITQKLLGISQINPFFDIVIQVSAISAAVWYFRKRIGEILGETSRAVVTKKSFSKMTHRERYGIWLGVSIIPTLLIGFVFRDLVDIWQESIEIIIVTTGLFGIIFYLVETWSKKQKTKKPESITLPNLLIMGITQSLSIIPGVSRSGSTIVGGLTQRISMKESVEISFIMGIPIIYIAGLYKIFSHLDSFTLDSLLPTIIGCIVSFFVSIFSIKLTLGVLTKHGFYPFMLYRIGLALVLTILYFNNLV
jgi:undecaprenyl-diphosphatase